MCVEGISSVDIMSHRGPDGPEILPPKGSGARQLQDGPCLGYTGTMESVVLWFIWKENSAGSTKVP